VSSPSAGRSRPGFDIWPGFVDALATLLMVIIFVLLVFVLSQFYLSAALSGRDEALGRLNRQISELAQMLSIEKETSAELRLNIAQLAAELQASTAARDQLQVRVGDLSRERDSLMARVAQGETLRLDLERRLSAADVLRQQIEQRLAQTEQARNLTEQERARLQQQLALTEQERAKLEAAQKLDRAQIDNLVAEGARLLADVDALRKLRDQLETRVGQMAARLQASEREVGALRDTSKQLEARLATEEERRRAEEAAKRGAEERTLLAQRELQQRMLLALRAQDETQTKLTEQQRLTRDAQEQVELLNRQMLALRQQLARIAAALDASEEKAKEQQVQIADLGRRLNLALASKVEELARYRSEFFGRLREALGDRPDIRVVGDRFVFQSEVLFDSGSAVLGLEGQEQLWQLARTLKDVAQSIPSDIKWILQVDGHTDTVRIATPQFPSNWELSTARATSVVKFLISQGLPAQRLAAAGYGEFQPLDEGGADEAARRRNRRIELKLTSR
jgi:chemotaxis protein MotB